MKLFFICRVVLLLLVYQNMSLHHLFFCTNNLHHVIILIKRIRGIFQWLIILENMAIVLLEIHRKYVKYRTMDQCQLLEYILVGLMNGHGIIWIDAWEHNTYGYLLMYYHTMVLFLAFDYFGVLDWDLTKDDSRLRVSIRMFID